MQKSFDASKLLARCNKQRACLPQPYSAGVCAGILSAHMMFGTEWKPLSGPPQPTILPGHLECRRAILNPNPREQTVRIGLQYDWQDSAWPNATSKSLPHYHIGAWQTVRVSKCTCSRAGAQRERAGPSGFPKTAVLATTGPFLSPPLLTAAQANTLLGALGLDSQPRP